MLINTELQYKNALQCAAIKGKKFWTKLDTVTPTHLDPDTIRPYTVIIFFSYSYLLLYIWRMLISKVSTSQTLNDKWLQR
jgi:hypothetical protein